MRRQIAAALTTVAVLAAGLAGCARSGGTTSVHVGVLSKQVKVLEGINYTYTDKSKQERQGTLSAGSTCNVLYGALVEKLGDDGTVVAAKYQTARRTCPDGAKIAVSSTDFANFEAGYRAIEKRRLADRKAASRLLSSKPAVQQVQSVSQEQYRVLNPVGIHNNWTGFAFWSKCGAYTGPLSKLEVIGQVGGETVGRYQTEHKLEYGNSCPSGTLVWVGDQHFDTLPTFQESSRR